MKKRSFKSIVSINPYSNTFYESRNSKIKKLPSLKFSKSNFYVSFLSTKNFIVSQVSISKNIPEEDLKDAIEIKAYEDLGLDQTIEYKIEYLEIPTLPSDKDRKFHVFVADPTVIMEDFEKIAEKIKYIDIIYPAPLLFKYLYQKDLVDNEGSHVFIYFQRDDAFLALYKEGRYLYSKSLKYSFNDMAERFSELLGERIDEEDFINLLATEGLRTSNFEYQQHLMKLFSEVFMHLNDVLIYAKRANDIDKIDKIFISSEFGHISGIDEYAQTYLGLLSLDFSFDYGFQTEETFIEDLHYLLHTAAIITLENEEEVPNFTLFKRPPPLLQRPSGQLFAVTAASMLLAFAYPLYNFAYNYKLQYDTYVLKQEYNKLHPERVRLETTINSLKKDKKNILAKISNEQKIYKTRMNILDSIYNKKVNYPMKGKIIAELSQDIIKFKVNTKSVRTDENNMEWDVVSKDEKRITNFIKYISHKKGDRYHIETNKIEKDEKEKIYKSTIKVVIK
ncbi:hypothetical protein [Nitrosophilus kaiyonis]|uniref:hypothetical protein n=1 Tax=Nitrosophilus kaiyonis TaxID=2930200 RepID=UPI0024918EFC|nr:hypothetical protein [Nitrosophilus kaiyonis]